MADILSRAVAAPNRCLRVPDIKLSALGGGYPIFVHLATTQMAPAYSSQAHSSTASQLFVARRGAASPVAAAAAAAVVDDKIPVPRHIEQLMESSLMVMVKPSTTLRQALDTVVALRGQRTCRWLCF